MLSPVDTVDLDYVRNVAQFPSYQMLRECDAELLRLQLPTNWILSFAFFLLLVMEVVVVVGEVLLHTKGSSELHKSAEAAAPTATGQAIMR